MTPVPRLRAASTIPPTIPRTIAPAIALCIGLASAGLAQAQGTAPVQSPVPATDTPVVTPPVPRREPVLPRFPSRDWEAGAFGGVYQTQNFGGNAVGGLRLAYHVTEDVFVEASLGRTRVSDEAFRRILPGGVFAQRTETLSYLGLAAGVNLLPGEVFLGRDRALASQVYAIGGVGTTTFVDQRKQTFQLGFGLRLFLSPRIALRLDVRDHVFPLDLLGERRTTQNLELTTGASVLF